MSLNPRRQACRPDPVRHLHIGRSHRLDGDRASMLWGFRRLGVAALVFVMGAVPVAAGTPAAGSPAGTPDLSRLSADKWLPPALVWQGASAGLALPPDSTDPWITPSEKTGLTATPDYEETVDWLRRLVAASPQLGMTSLGRSGEGRDIWLVTATADGKGSPEDLARSDKPVVLVQAGIHSGEIDGKDAGLMLLRDLTVKGKHPGLLDKVHWLFVPIFNVDGHERRSPHGRVNQRGPEAMGWRTNGRNLNLNRDYSKADAPAMQAMLRALNAYRPDLYVDVHVTDGIDYQYDITWGYGGDHGHSPAIARWLETVLDPPVVAHLESQGHVPGYLVFAGDNGNPDASLFKWSSSSPRYSDGYGSARHLPTILVENHSLKPYPQRVVGTYLLIESILRTVGEEADSLRQAIAKDRALRPQRVPLGWKVDRSVSPEEVTFKGVTWERATSEATGTEVVRWLGQPVTKTLPRVEATAIDRQVTLPAAWWVPAAWGDVIDRLRLHGIEMETIDAPRQVTGDFYRLHGAKIARAPFEGRVRVEPGETTEVERHTMRFGPGSVRVPADQPLGELAALLLEPESQDSFFQWGFFTEILSRTEYVEGYVMAPMADRMLKEDPALAERFQKALRDDAELAANPRRRLQWFYRQTPFHDQRYLLYPVAREPVAAP